MGYKKIFFSLLFVAALAAVLLFWIFDQKKPEEKTISLPEPVPTEEMIEKYYPDTIPEMSEKNYSGSDLKLGKILEDLPEYTRYEISYKSEGFTISGALNIPNRDGTFPVLILNHGYYNPRTYDVGEGLSREQDFFAKNGYAVLSTDYRDHAKSDVDPKNDVRPRSGYVEDSINAVNAIKEAKLESLDTNTIGMLGHSMGGGVTLNVMVTKPDTAKAYALLAPINSDYKVNFEKWVSAEWPETAQNFYNIYGKYEENPDVWEKLSAKNYFSRISSPIMLHQGTADREVPVEWSRELETLLKKEGKEITYFEYPGEDHSFIKAQDLAMQRTLDFFDNILK